MIHGGGPGGMLVWTKVVGELPTLISKYRHMKSGKTMTDDSSMHLLGKYCA